MNTKDCFVRILLNRCIEISDGTSWSERQGGNAVCKLYKGTGRKLPQKSSEETHRQHDLLTSLERRVPHRSLIHQQTFCVSVKASGAKQRLLLWAVLAANVITMAPQRSEVPRDMPYLSEFLSFTSISMISFVCLGILQVKKSTTLEFRAIKDRFSRLEDVQNALRTNGLESSQLVVGIDFTKVQSTSWSHCTASLVRVDGRQS